MMDKKKKSHDVSRYVTLWCNFVETFVIKVMVQPTLGNSSYNLCLEQKKKYMSKTSDNLMDFDIIKKDKLLAYSTIYNIDPHHFNSFFRPIVRIFRKILRIF